MMVSSAAVGHRILVLDDDPLLRRALTRVASSRDGVDLDAVGTTAEVLERLEAGDRYDLIVCDYRLRIDGRNTTSAELVRELARRGLPVAIMTGDLDTLAPDLAGVRLLEKPLRLDDLLAAATRA